VGFSVAQGLDVLALDAQNVSLKETYVLFQET
jgi:hypothetical protein